MINLANRFLLSCLGAMALSVPAHAADYSVDVNKTKILKLPVSASAIVVGNPQIADISVHSADTVFLVGRAYGETNMIVLDHNGVQVMDSTIRVINTVPSAGIQLHKIGQGRETYNCAPYCSPAPVHGDARQFVSSFQGRATPINNASAGSARTQVSSPPQPINNSYESLESVPTGNGQPQGANRSTLQQSRATLNNARRQRPRRY